MLGSVYWAARECGMPFRQWRPEIESPDDIWTDGVLDVSEGVSSRFAGSYESEVRAQKKLALFGIASDDGVVQATYLDEACSSRELSCNSDVRKADVMVPMAIPSFGGMLVVLLSVFVTPVLYIWVKERRVES